jgi:hypothetical protein
MSETRAAKIRTELNELGNRRAALESALGDPMTTAHECGNRARLLKLHLAFCRAMLGLDYSATIGIHFERETDESVESVAL